MNRASLTPEAPCRNCGDATPGNYCPTCGQAKRDVRVSVRVMMADVLEDQLMLGRALPSTLSALLFKPGELTREYMAGRIVRYVAPFRLYLASSVVFFVLFSVVGVGSVYRSAQVVDAGERPVATAADPEADVQPWARNLTINIASEATNERVRQRVIDRFGRMPVAEATRGLWAEYIRYVPHMIFLLLPLFAATLKILYVRRGRYYAEHFVFALHVHAFFFAVLTLILIVRWPPAQAVLAGATTIYLWAAMKRVYEQGWFRTTLKWATLGTAYSLVLIVGLALTLVVTLVML